MAVKQERKKKMNDETNNYTAYDIGCETGTGVAVCGVLALIGMGIYAMAKA